MDTTADHTHGFNESSDAFTVRFEGGSVVDLELFTKTMESTFSLVRLAAQTVNPDAFVKLNLKATKEGSFETVIDAVVRESVNLFTQKPYETATFILTAFVSFFEIKRHLKGKNKKSIRIDGEKAFIENEEGGIVVVQKSVAHHWHIADRYVCDIFSELKRHDCDGLSVEHARERNSFSRNDYEAMSTPQSDDDVPQPTQYEEIFRNQELPVRKPDLVGNSKWELVFGGRYVLVKIDDEDFAQKIRNGDIKLSGGSKLVADIKFCSEEHGGVMRSLCFATKVYGIKDKHEQMSLLKKSACPPPHKMLA